MADCCSLGRLYWAIAVAFNEVKRLRVLRQRLEVERHVALAVFVRLHKLVHVLFNIQCFLDDGFQFFSIRRGGENGAVTVDEEHGTSAIAGSVFAPHIVLVV